MKMITKDNLYEDFAIILELTDANILFIEECPNRVFNPIIMQELMKSKGNNAHVINISLINDISIAHHIVRLLDIYQSVSWVNENHKFFIRRNLTPLLN